MKKGLLVFGVIFGAGLVFTACAFPSLTFQPTSGITAEQPAVVPEDTPEEGTLVDSVNSEGGSVPQLAGDIITDSTPAPIQHPGLGDGLLQTQR